MVYLVGEVDYERVQRAPLLAPAEVFEGMGKTDDVFKTPGRVLDGYAARSDDTHWLSLSTRSPKLSLPSTLGTPASSEGHRGVNGEVMFRGIYITTIDAIAMAAGA